MFRLFQISLYIGVFVGFGFLALGTLGGNLSDGFIDILREYPSRALGEIQTAQAYTQPKENVITHNFKTLRVDSAASDREARRKIAERDAQIKALKRELSKLVRENTVQKTEADATKQLLQDQQQKMLEELISYRRQVSQIKTNKKEFKKSSFPESTELEKLKSENKSLKNRIQAYKVLDKQVAKSQAGIERLLEQKSKLDREIAELRILLRKDKTKKEAFNDTISAQRQQLDRKDQEVFSLKRELEAKC